MIDPLIAYNRSDPKLAKSTQKYISMERQPTPDLGKESWCAMDLIIDNLKMQRHLLVAVWPCVPLAILAPRLSWVTRERTGMPTGEREKLD